MGWIVDDGITGIKVKPADAHALAGALKQLLANHAEMKKMGRAGKDKFDHFFEINHAIEGLVDIYKLAQHSGPKEQIQPKSR